MSFLDKIICFFTNLLRFNKSKVTSKIEVPSNESQDCVIYYDHPLVVTKPFVQESNSNENFRTSNSHTNTHGSVSPGMSEGELYCKVRPLFRSVGDVEDEIVRVGRKHPSWDRKQILEYILDDFRRK